MTNTHNTTTTNKDDLLKLYSSFINSFDGTSGAFERAEPIMDKLFDPSLTIITDDGPKDLDWYRNFAKSFAAEAGNTAKVTHIKPTPQGIQVSIKNVVAGIELDLITFNGTAETDENEQLRITYFEPAGEDDTSSKNQHLENVGKMVQLVGDSCESPEGKEEEDSEIMFICKMIICSDKFVDFQYHARKAVRKIKSTETEGTLSFDMYLSESVARHSCHTVERYRDSSSALEHILNMQKNEDRNAAITQYSQVTVLEVYGRASEELKDLLSKEDYLVQYYGSCGISI